MPLISIVLSVYNAENYISQAVDSVLGQSFKDWELFIVDDGSTDESLVIVKEFALRDGRINVVSKENGGYVSARLFGLNLVSDNSKYLLFFDADDILERDMLQKLVEILESDSSLGAAFCNHRVIGEKGEDLGLPAYGVRLLPTLFWMKRVPESVPETAFISIFCWAVKMIEPMTMIRKEAYLGTRGWDLRFGKGKGNIGDGTLLFGELALEWGVIYTSEVLYKYRKHPAQATVDPALNAKARNKVLSIWRERLAEVDFRYKHDIKGAIICYEHRMNAFSLAGSLKYLLRYKPLKFIQVALRMAIHWMLSLQLIFFRNSKVYQQSL